ncbi:hypothetical protein OKW43_001263 [Paraburkholderia sp. WC7.3g]|uniref:DUF1987 domain-containing protein n=1 Tax=Paraburkholderia sp. WC7.3g TaxID=2991070 RepID=UPI003D1DCFAA
MENLHIPATTTSPEVDFRFDQHALSIRGESYPENAAAFFAPIIEQMRKYLAANAGAEITVDVALTYFNSSSTKMLFNIFDALDQAAESGTRVLMNWYRDEEDETIAEFGEELKSDFRAIEFTDRPITQQGR